MAQKGCGTWPKRECWKTEEPCPEKAETCSVNTKPCTSRSSVPFLRWRVLGIPWIVLCVCACFALFILVVTVPISDANVDL